MRSLEVQDVSKRFRLGERRYITLRETISAAVSRNGQKRTKQELWALRGVSFDVDEGEVVGLIGRNGAGKSTLLRILARITEPTRGTARMRGRVGALLEVGTGFHPELNGRENVYLNGAILGMRRADIRRRFDDIVEFAGVEKFLETPVKRYSSGMFLRLAFAVAAHVEPDIVVVDEVLAVGDAEFQRKCLGKMSEFGREGRTVIFVSHDLGAIARVCRRGIWLEEGTVRHDGPVGRSIELYLDARAERAARVDLSPDPTGIVQPLSVAVEDPAGDVLETPRRDEAFVIRTRFRVREPVRGLDLRLYLATRRGIRVLEERLSDEPGAACGSLAGEWEASLVVPPVLAAGDYVLGLELASPYQRFFEREVLTFRLLPTPAEATERGDRNRLVQPAVTWTVTSPARSGDGP